MSAFVGIVNLSGAPVDAVLLETMTERLAPRGPDARGTWHEGCAGLGHVLLRTTDESALETQPFSFDGATWIVADARVDARAELVAGLNAAGRDASPGRPDVELLLHAWHAWGAACVERLLGDFAFAVWDGPRQRLFCARDHFGIKPLFYAHRGDAVVFGSSLASLRGHPAVRSTLDDLAIADFLVFGHPQDRESTSFADIRRLAPAHTGTWTAEGASRRRYWTLPIEEPLYLKRSAEYPERLAELLREAVRDRTRTDRIGIMMSGGVDSTLLASFAKDALDERGGSARLAAFTNLAYPGDEEGLYAAAAAKAIGIPIRYFESYKLVEATAEPRIVITDEPSEDPAGLAIARQEYADMAGDARVLFFGEGPDNALVYEWERYLAWLWSRRDLRRLVRDVAAHIVAHRRVPLVGNLLRNLRRNQIRFLDLITTQVKQIDAEEDNPFPPWLEPGLVERFRLKERWVEGIKSRVSSHPLRPRGHGSFDLALWQEIFRGFDFDHTGQAIEVRHPYLDLRVLRFLLQVPALPWCRAKHLLRRVAQGRLPENVRRRPKTPLVGDPSPYPDLPGIEADDPVREALSRYVDIIGIAASHREAVGFHWIDTRPKALAAWMRQSRGIS